MKHLSLAVLILCCSFANLSFANTFKEYTPPNLIICDYQKDYQVQFDLYKNSGWVTRPINNKTIQLIQPFSFKPKIEPVASRDGTMIKYTFSIVNAIATVIMLPSGKDGKGTMIMNSNKKIEFLTDCYQL